MNANLLVSTLSGLICAAAVFFAVQTARSNRDAETSLAAHARKQAALAEELRAAKQRLAIAKESAAAIQISLDELARTKPTTTEASAPKTHPPPAPPNPRELVLNDPRLQALWLASARTAVLRQYGPLLTALELSPGQIAEFQDNVIRQQEQLMDLAGAAQSQGAGSKQPIEMLRAKVRDEFIAAQTNLLGSEGWSRLREYERSATVRNIVEGFAGLAVLNGSPLTRDQGDQLAAVLAGATRDFAAGGRADASSIDWAVVDAAVAQVLTPAQESLFKSAAPLTNALSRWTVQLDAAIQRAQQADARPKGAAASRPPGG